MRARTPQNDLLVMRTLENCRTLVSMELMLTRQWTPSRRNSTDSPISECTRLREFLFSRPHWREAGTRWVDLHSWQKALRSKVLSDAAPLCCELGVFIEVHIIDLHGTSPRPASRSPDSDRGGHEVRPPNRQRVLYNDRTEIVPNAKYLRLVLSQHGADASQPQHQVTAGYVKQKLDDDVDLGMQECRLYRWIFGSLQYLSVIAVTCNLRRVLAQRDETADMAATETSCSRLGGRLRLT